MTKTSFLALVIAAASITACSSDSSQKKTNDTAVMNTKPAAPAVKVTFDDKKSEQVYDDYLRLKNYLVASTPGDAQSAAAALETSLKSAGNEKAAQTAGTIAGSKDLAKQRSVFNELTAEVEKTLRSGELSSGTIYKQYCPMANDGNGGYWLSGESEIRNPYYGDDMLECGEVKEQITQRSK